MSRRGVSGEILDGVADLDEGLFDPAAGVPADQEGVGVGPPGEEGVDGAVVLDLDEEVFVGRGEPEVTGVVVEFEAESAVAGDVLSDLGEDVFGDGVFGELLEVTDDVLGGVAGGGGVPQREGGNAVGVHVVGALDELGEGGQGVAGGREAGIERFQQEGAVGLDDERVVGIRRHGRSRAGEQPIMISRGRGSVKRVLGPHLGRLAL